jgi:homoserine/homoserine lactone efflux protein
MSIEAILIFSVLCLLTLYLPSASSRFLVAYSIARGKLRAMALVPALAAGSFLSFAAGFAIFLWLSVSLRSMHGALGWAALAYLVFYVGKGLQQGIRQRAADNDNLREKSLVRGMGRCLIAQVRPGLAIAFAALLVHLADSSGTTERLALQAATAFAVAAIASGLLKVLLAGRSTRKMRLVSLKNSASATPRTRFIARRAVSAGYRRIAA